MKKLYAVLLACLLAISCFSSALALEIDYASLTDAELDELIREATAERSNRQATHVPVAVNPSPDKYTWYVQDYVGRNAAGFGYTSLGGDRLEQYGAGYLEFVFVTEDGMYIDIEDEALLQKYIVTGQNLAPNTEMKYVFRKDSSGKEYSNLLDFQSVRLIDLAVKRIDGTMAGDPVAFELIPINPSPDKYTAYIRNYVGKNVASFGYTSLGGDRRDEYGAGNIKFNFVADDGSYLDPENMDILKQYVVTAQDVAPNSEMKLIFRRDSKGNEYSNLIDSQTYQSITLYVHKLNLIYPDMDTTASAEENEKAVEPTETKAVVDSTVAPVTADGTVLSYRDIKYRLMSDGNIEICGYTKAQSSITIPSEIDGRKVTKIAEGAFENCTALKDLLNWADLTYIGANAFKGCTGLKDISIPGETTFIGESAFEGCSDLDTVILWGGTNIGNSAFRQCTSLEEISISSDTEYIGDYAFEGCSSLSNVIMWGRSTKIGKNAFSNCPNLKKIPR